MMEDGMTVMLVFGPLPRKLTLEWLEILRMAMM